MIPNQEYLEAIKRKLDAMNKVAGVNPSIKSEQGQVWGEPKSFDVMDWQGQASMNYLKSIGKNPNLSDI
jgi:4-alpha-glucanotransferase